MDAFKGFNMMEAAMEKINLEVARFFQEAVYKPSLENNYFYGSQNISYGCSEMVLGCIYVKC
jgi:hypothetical protein